MTRRVTTGTGRNTCYRSTARTRCGRRQVSPATNIPEHPATRRYRRRLLGARSGGAHAQAYQALSTQAAAFHNQFVQTLSAGAASYASAEAANAAQTLQQDVLGVINAPTQMLLGRCCWGAR
nr:PE family protein [Mycobacterium ostraviense]